MLVPTIPAPLAGKVALVTGGSRGIGRGIALHFATKAVAKIAITYASKLDAAEEVLAEVRKINPNVVAVAIQADVLSSTFARDLVPKVIEGLSTQTVDIVVNNAALADGRATQPIASATKDNFDAFMTANAWAPVQLFLAALPYLPRGGGRVIMIGSVASKIPNTDPVVNYGASKAALDSFTRSLALKYSAAHGITINSVSVGPTRTDVISEGIESGVIDDEFLRVLTSRSTADKRLGEVEDVAAIVGFLASEESRWINGNNVPANGGGVLDLQG